MLPVTCSVSTAMVCSIRIGTSDCKFHLEVKVGRGPRHSQGAEAAKLNFTVAFDGRHPSPSPPPNLDIHRDAESLRHWKRRQLVAAAANDLDGGRRRLSGTAGPVPGSMTRDRDQMAPRSEPEGPPDET
jgi:hypothetical protein